MVVMYREEEEHPWEEQGLGNTGLNAYSSIALFLSECVLNRSHVPIIPVQNKISTDQ